MKCVSIFVMTFLHVSYILSQMLRKGPEQMQAGGSLENSLEDVNQVLESFILTSDHFKFITEVFQTSSASAKNDNN